MSKKLISKILTIVLIAISIGGVGAIGYSIVFGESHSGSGMATATTNYATQEASTVNTASKETQSAMLMDTQKEAQAGQQSVEQTNVSSQVKAANSKQVTNANGQTQIANNQPATNANAQNQPIAGIQQAAYDPEAIKQSAAILQNRENLSKTITKINEALAIMTLDPYAPDAGSQDNVDRGNVQNANEPAADAQSNTGTQASSNPAAAVMQNMGAQYDVEKMTQLHNGLYKMAMGKMLLDQLSDELATQAELAYKNTLSPLQFYSNQYNLTLQYNAKLNQAFAFINEAAGLVNINPYVGSDGMAYDNVRMENIHQSVYKLAEGVVALSSLSDAFTSQSIQIAGLVQAANMNVQAANQNAQAVNPNAQTAGQNAQTSHQNVQAVTHNAKASDGSNNGAIGSASGSIFSNFNVSGAVNIILILFVAGLILGIIGFVISLIKNADKAQTNE